MKFRLLVSWLTLTCFALPAGAGELEGVRMHEAPDYTRVVFDTTTSVGYHLFVLTNPHRVVIDLANTRAESGFDPSLVAVNPKRVKGLRASPRGQDYRVVLDLTKPLKPKAFTLQPVPPYGHRLVVDLYGARRTAGPVAAPRKDTKRDVVIAIDAGHGGEDPGATGTRRIREKDVVLKIARVLAGKLDAASGYRAVLVRTGDYYVSLRKRQNIARRARADLFVSIHADAFDSPKVSGASVYTLSDKGASSEMARWLAEKENRSDLIGGVGDVSLDDKDDLLAHVLLDISMDANRSASIEAGESVLGRLSVVARMHKRRVEQAGFVVLKSPDIPSVLIETGYISNPAEARRLHSSAYQRQLATALYDGIRDYMARSAPPGTLVAWQRERGGIRYTIERGDTLSAIAMRYGTSARRIKETNGISTDSIRVGQVIVIPAS
ncbi:MAG: N-acetylmuramoyl-L-alanine amidase [Gammaproteobacteria bacterium]|nr:N-acetylmuramoyl-L-alanine amidase [Gammaproteobacteria bacterium]